MSTLILASPSNRAHQGRKRPLDDGGFTLIELMITLTITAVLLGIGIPSFTSFIRGQAVKTASFDIASALLLARSEAIKRNSNVVLTRATGGWQNGWTVSVTAGGTTTNLATQSPFSGLTVTGPASTVTFGRNGRVQEATLPEFDISGTGSVRCIRVSLNGMPNTKRESCT